MRARDIGRRPVRVSIALNGCQRASESAVGIGPARQDMALVEMGVHVDEAGPDLAVIHVDSGRSETVPAGRSASILPSAMTISARIRPSPTSSPSKSTTVAAGKVALART